MKARTWYLIPLALLVLGAVAGCDSGKNAPPPPGYDTNHPGAIPPGARPSSNGPAGGGPSGGNPPGPPANTPR